MSEVTINNSPIHSPISITRPYGYVLESYTCGWHTGVDFVPYAETPSNPLIFPVKGGRVVYTDNNPNQALGVQVQILDDDGKYWRYCHMVLNSMQVQVGDIVTTETPIGIMGTTGNSTAIHLHLELASTQAWQCSTFENPCTALGIPNETGTIVLYDGEAPPVPPIPTHNKNNWKWFMSLPKRIIIK